MHIQEDFMNILCILSEKIRAKVRDNGSKKKKERERERERER